MSYGNDTKKINLGLMDDINCDVQSKEADDWKIAKNDTRSYQTNIDQQNNNLNGNLYQSRLDNFVDLNRNNFNKQPTNKPKKLFQNLRDFSFQKELRIKIFGVGGAGNNMVKYMSINSNINHESLFAINTDYQVLKTMPSDINIALIGDKITNGYGSGSNPEIGRKAAIESEEIIRNLLEETDLLFIVSGMGKGTGTGASPIIAKIAQEMNIMTLALVNLPSISNEGKTIYDRGQEGLKKLKQEVSGILTISNEKLFNETDDNISLEKAFNYANSVICNVIYEMINLITIPAQVNVDFNDVKTFFREPTMFQVNTFDFNTIENIESQIKEQLQNLIYQDNIEGARKAIVNFKLNPNVSREIVSNITKALMRITKNNELEITIAIDYFENIECARVSTLLAMEKTDDEHSVLEEPIKQKTIELEIINTKNDELEKKPKTIELITNELLDEEVHTTYNFKNNLFATKNQNESKFQSILGGFKELEKELNINGMNTTSNHQSYESNQKQEVRRNFIPTKKINEPKTIQFEHKTGPKQY